MSFLCVSDCWKKPKSVSKKANPNFPKGCPGAVWSNGKPSKKYCRGKTKLKTYNSWMKTCCIWKRSKCRLNPKFLFKITLGG